LVAADTSVLIPYFNGEKSDDLKVLDYALELSKLVLPPIVITEILRSPKATPLLIYNLSSLPKLKIKKDYWFRAAENGRLLLEKGLKAALADTLIAQSCIDHDVQLITRDGDFRHFAKYCGLKIYK